MCLQSLHQRLSNGGIPLLPASWISLLYQVHQGAEGLQLPARVDAEGEGKVEGEGEVGEVGREGAIAPIEEA